MADLTNLTDAELTDIADSANAELARRQRLAQYRMTLDEIMASSLLDRHEVPGGAWRQPMGADDAYPFGWQVTHAGTTWRSLISGNPFEPGVSGWREVVPEGQLASWRQPTNALDVYNLGEKVTHVGKTWESTIDANTTEPGAALSAWVEVVPEGVIPEWVQPGSENPYQAGDLVTHNGSTWRSDIGTNVWEPGVYGWTIYTP